MPISVEQDNLAVSEARQALLQSLDESPESPDLALVRRLGLAYLGPEPQKHTHATAHSQYDIDTDTDRKILHKTVNLISRLNVNGDFYDIQLTTATDHAKRNMMPGLAMLGHAAFQSQPNSAPLERLRLWVPDNIVINLNVSQGSTMPTLEMSDRLLRLPEHPDRITFPS